MWSDQRARKTRRISTIPAPEMLLRRFRRVRFDQCIWSDHVHESDSAQPNQIRELSSFVGASSFSTCLAGTTHVVRPKGTEDAPNIHNPCTRDAFASFP